MATLSTLVVRIKGNTAQLNKAIKSAQTRLDRFKRSAQNAFGALRRAALGAAVIGGAAIVGFAAASIKKFAQVGDEIQKMALRTGFSTEALSELKFAAEQAGTDLDTLEKGVKRMASVIFDANNGLTESVRAFTALGLSVEQFNGLSPEEQFFLFANALAQVEDASLKAAIAQDIFGRAGTQLLPLFAQGTEGMEALREKARELGIVFSQEDANAAAEFTDTMNELNKAIQGIQFSIGRVAVPWLTKFVNALTWTVLNAQKLDAWLITFTRTWLFNWDAMGKGLNRAINWMIQQINRLISAWNRLEFSFGGIDTPFGSIGGFSVGTPDIPLIPSIAQQPGNTSSTSTTNNVNFNGPVFGADDFDEKVNQAVLAFQRQGL